VIAAVMRTGDPRDSAHIAIGVDDAAIAQIEAIGGRLKYRPAVYPAPHAYEDAHWRAVARNARRAG
jgi:hypothetical protein